MKTFQIPTFVSLGDLCFRWRLQWQTRFRRVLRALRYATGRLSVEDAQLIVCDCERTAGWFPLLTLTVDDTLEQALEEYAEHPDLRRLVEEACSHVGGRWQSFNDDLHEARCWAMDKVREYAVAEGIELPPAAIEIQEQPADQVDTKQA